jgi:hypothetical protein
VDISVTVHYPMAGAATSDIHVERYVRRRFRALADVGVCQL